MDMRDELQLDLLMAINGQRDRRKVTDLVTYQRTRRGLPHLRPNPALTRLVAEGYARFTKDGEVQVTVDGEIYMHWLKGHSERETATILRKKYRVNKRRSGASI